MSTSLSLSRTFPEVLVGQDCVFMTRAGSRRSQDGEKPGSEPEEVKLQKASKQIVRNAILQAVQQVSQESRQKGESARDSQGSLQLGVGELTKKHEKK
uniref:A-kinase anchor protein inhibitor 1 n=1 Tax=Callorhinus ursinus TaxID=34884 RepID=A0A3Q7Q988_CALUR|nr:A-kinase anchor protein inhibitor 1 [Callorhinus ursinus]